MSTTGKTDKQKKDIHAAKDPKEKERKKLAVKDRKFEHKDIAKEGLVSVPRRFGWKKRWMIARNDGQVFFFKNSACKQMTSDYFELKSAGLIKTIKKEKGHDFAFKVKLSDEVWIGAVENEEERRTWISLLQSLRDKAKGKNPLFATTPQNLVQQQQYAQYYQQQQYAQYYQQYYPQTTAAASTTPTAASGVPTVASATNSSTSNSSSREATAPSSTPTPTVATTAQDPAAQLQQMQIQMQNLQQYQQYLQYQQYAQQYPQQYAQLYAQQNAQQYPQQYAQLYAQQNAQQQQQTTSQAYAPQRT